VSFTSALLGRILIRVGTAPILVLSKVFSSFSLHFRRNRRYINHLGPLNAHVDVFPIFSWLERSPYVAQAS
jgi:hypothetical protein